MKVPIVTLAVLVLAVIGAIFMGPLVPAVVIALAMTASIITARTRRGALTALALLWLGSTILAGWLWRVGFQRAESNLPELPWTGLWLPLVVVSLVALVVFFGLYVMQGRASRSHHN